MYKNDVFLIKRSAHKILVEGYKQCNAELVCRDFNYQSAIGENCTQENAGKCKSYLEDIGAITHTGDRTYNSFKITGKGIEIAEEIIFNSPPSPGKPKEREPYKPNSVRIEGRDFIKAGGSKRKFEAIFTDENCNSIEMSPSWTFECDPSKEDCISFCVRQDNTCEIGASDVNELIGTHVKLTVSDQNGTRQDEKLIEIVGLFD